MNAKPCLAYRTGSVSTVTMVGYYGYRTRALCVVPVIVGTATLQIRQLGTFPTLSQTCKEDI